MAPLAVVVLENEWNFGVSGSIRLLTRRTGDDGAGLVGEGNVGGLESESFDCTECEDLITGGLPLITGDDIVEFGYDGEGDLDKTWFFRGSNTLEMGDRVLEAEKLKADVFDDDSSVD